MDKQNCFRIREVQNPPSRSSSVWPLEKWFPFRHSEFFTPFRCDLCDEDGTGVGLWLTVQRSINLSWAGECWWGADEAVVSCKFSWSSERVYPAKIWSALTAIPIVIAPEDFISRLAAESNISEGVTSPTFGTSFPKVLVGPNYSGTMDKLQFYYGRT